MELVTTPGATPPRSLVAAVSFRAGSPSDSLEPTTPGGIQSDKERPRLALGMCHPCRAALRNR